MQLKYLAAALSFILMIGVALTYNYSARTPLPKSENVKHITTITASGKQDTVRKKEIISID